VIFVGTSGWQYRWWKGAFYPDDVPQRGWLRYYAARFPVVEVNNSFYQLPRESTFSKWRGEAPDGFMFVVKASRYITHIRRLRNCRDPVDLLWSRATLLEEKLGPVLFQFPPNFRADAPLLNEFLSVLPEKMQAAFEFRDDSWRVDTVLEALDGAGAAWVLADRPGKRVPLVVTGGWPHHPKYSRSKLRTWADRIAGLKADDVYAFFNNDGMAAAPEDAATLIKLLGRRNLDVYLRAS
jgi:uncharacterized protein YecE (DUF72 family)